MQAADTCRVGQNARKLLLVAHAVSTLPILTITGSGSIRVGRCVHPFCAIIQAQPRFCFSFLMKLTSFPCLWNLYSSTRSPSS